MMNRILIFKLFILLFVVSCATTPEAINERNKKFAKKYTPEITIVDRNIKEITLKEITVELVLDVNNKLSIEIPVDRFTIELIDRESKNVFATITEKNNFKIPAKKRITKKAIFKAKYSDLFKTAFNSIKNKDFKCISKTTITYTILGIHNTFSYTELVDFREQK